ncbi:MAG: hypothetical protein QE271_06425 [Bacteriovoracaceae bacterium]|nr:hypothetical protein [Bacteriovoracaceae bacterium]
MTNLPSKEFTGVSSECTGEVPCADALRVPNKQVENGPKIAPPASNNKRRPLTPYSSGFKIKM